MYQNVESCVGNGDLNIMEVKTMENGSSIRKLCIIFGVMVIALAGFMSAVSASPQEDGGDSRREAALGSLSEDMGSKISPSLALKMKERQIGDIAVIIEMKEQQKVSFDVREAKSLAVRSQKPLASALEEMQAKDIKPYWIIDAMSATVPVQEICAIAARQDVKKVWLDKKIKRIETASATSGPEQDGNMVANPLSNDSGYSPDRIVNYASTSSVDKFDASGYATTMLYLRPDLTGPPYDDYLSEDPETSGVHVKEHITRDGDYLVWGNYTLKEDINGTLYSYGIYFASESSTTFEIEIIINGTMVAAFSNLTVPYNPHYLPFSEEVTGMDPTTSDGDGVILKITKIYGGNGSVLFGTWAYSHIAMPSIDIADYGDDIINAPLVWDQGYDGSDVKISILDTGIDGTHPDLVGKVIAEEDFTDDGTTDDLQGHGTHCAGIAAGTYNTMTNVTGVAPGATLINAKVLNETGYGSTSWILSGIEWSIEQNADILSMSFGDEQREDGTGRDLEAMAVTNAVNAGYVVVVAAGNSGPGESTIGSPAVAYGAIAVAASDSSDAIVDFSSRGPTGDGRVGIDVAAPGYKIIAPNAFWESNVDYVLKSGTSMSCPHVAGAAALLLQANPDLTPDGVESALKNGADNIADDVTGVTDGSKVIYYAFDLDDIDNTTIQPELIENSESWLRVVESPTRSVLIIDDDNDIHSGDDQSVDLFRSAFEGLGYNVTNESSGETSYSTWSDYDIVVWSCGDDLTPVYDPEYKGMLVDYVTGGGRLIIESGEIASWIKQHGSQVMDRELREKVLHATADWVYSDVGDLAISTRHPVATTPNLLPGVINFTPTGPGDDSGDADAVRILPDAVGVCNWSSVAYGATRIDESVACISYSLIAYEQHENDADAGSDVWEQGAGRLDVKDAYDALTKGILVDSQWIVGKVRPGSYTKRFTVVNSNFSEKIVSITRSTGDAGDWITLPANLTVPAGGTASFDAAMDVPGDAIGAYKGSIRVNDGTEWIIIPVSINMVWDDTRIGDITGSVDEDFWYDTSSMEYGGDWVYYTLDVPVTTNLNLSLDWTDTINDLDLQLFNPDGTLTNTSFYDKPEMITVDNPLAGYWTVAINAWELRTDQETYTLNISVSGEDTTPPSVTGPSATPESIAADGIQTTQLNVTVTDPGGVGVVTVNLSAIGGSQAQAMTLIAGDVYTTTTIVAVGTKPATYCLSVNATDNFGNSNTTKCIILDVAEPVEYGVDLNVDVIKQTVTPDENAIYVLTVLNSAGQSDSFTLNITINEADTGELSKTFVSLASGASETVHLIVSDSTDGVYNTTIVAVSEGNPSKKDAVTVETTVETEAVTIIAIGDAIASTGGDGDVTPVIINNVVNAGVVRIDMHYDPSVVRVVDVAGGDFDFITSSIDNAAGVVRIGAMQVASSGLNGDVLLAEVTLQAKGSQGNTSALSIDIKELKDATPQCNPIHAGVEDGIFTVSCLCGDVNEDGNVLLDDAMYLVKHCVEEPGFEQINECASDVDCDGAINMADAMYLAKHCVGVQGFETLHCCAGQQ